METRDLLCQECIETQANLVIKHAQGIRLICNACHVNHFQSDPSSNSILLTIDYNTIQDLLLADDQDFQHARSSLTAELHDYRAKLKMFKTDVQDSQPRMEEVLKRTVSSSLDHLDSIDKDILDQLAVLELHTAVPTIEGLHLLKSFIDSGLHGILNPHHRDMKIHDRLLLDQLEKFIYISDSPEITQTRDEVEISYSLEEEFSNPNREIIAKKERIPILRNEQEDRPLSTDFVFVKSSPDSSSKSYDCTRSQLIDEIERKLRKTKAKVKELKYQALIKDNTLQIQTAQIVRKDQEIQNLKENIDYIEKQNVKAALDQYKDLRIKELEENVNQLCAKLRADQAVDPSYLSNLSGVQSCISEELSDSERKDYQAELQARHTEITVLRDEILNLKDLLYARDQHANQIKDTEERISHTPEESSYPVSYQVVSIEGPHIHSLKNPYENLHTITNPISFTIQPCDMKDLEINDGKQLYKEDDTFFQLSAELEELRQSEHAKDLQIEKLIEQLHYYKRVEYEQIQKDNQSLVAKNKESTHEIEHFTSQINVLNQENAVLSDECNTFCSDLTTCQKAKEEGSLENSCIDLYLSSEVNKKHPERLNQFMTSQQAKQELEASLKNSYLKDESDKLLADLLSIQQAKQDLEATLPSQIDSLTFKNTQLNSEIQALRQAFSDKKAENIQLSLQMTQSLTFYKEKEHDYISHIDHLTTQLQVLKDKNTELPQSLSIPTISRLNSDSPQQVLNDNEALKKQIQDMRDVEVKNIQKERQSTSTVLYQLEQEKKQTEQLKNDLQQKDIINDTLRKELDIAGARLSLPNSPEVDRIQQLEAELSRYRSSESQEVTRLNKEIKDAQSHITYLTGELKNSKLTVIQKLLNEKSETITAQASQAKALENVISDLESKNKQYELDINNYVLIINDQQNQLNNFQTKPNTSSLQISENELLKKQLAEYACIIESQRLELESAKRSDTDNRFRHEHFMRIEKRNSDLETELNTAKRRLETELNTAKRRLETENKLEQERSIRLEMRSTDVNAGLNMRIGQIQDAHQKNAELNNQLQHLQSERAVQKEQLDHLRTEFERILNQLKDKDLTIQRLDQKSNEDLSRLNAHLESQNDQLLQLTERFSLLEFEKTALQKENEALKLKDMNISAQISSFNASQQDLLDSRKQIAFLKAQLQDFFISESSSLLTEESRKIHYSKYSGSRYIYLPLATNLIEYDVFTNTQKPYDLSGQFDRQFNNSSSCVLPNGDVFITGFSDPVSADAYIFVVRNMKLIKIQNAPVAKHYMSVVFHADCVFVFGGHDGKASTNTAARFDLRAQQWFELPNMQKARIGASSIAVNDYIFIFGGENEPSVEYFTISSNIFNVLVMSIGSNFVVAALHNELIYLVGEKGLKVLDSNLQNKTENYGRWNSLCCSIHNVVKKDGMIYFLNHQKIVEFLDTKTLMRDLLQNRIH